MSYDFSTHPRAPQSPVVVGKGQLEIPYYLHGDDKLVEECGCNWRPGADHMVGCPVPRVYI